MKKKVCALLSLAFAFVASDVHADNAVRATAEQLRDQALNDSTAWNVTESLATEIGARPVGSPAMERAKDWALAKLSVLGLQHVHAEEFTKENAWFRGAEFAQVTAPTPQRNSQAWFWPVKAISGQRVSIRLRSPATPGPISGSSI